MFGRRRKRNDAMEMRMEKSQLKRETRTRKIWALISSFLFLVSFAFLILCEVGMTSPSTLPNVYFIKLDLSHVVPNSVPNFRLINSVAQSLGLHDFYQVGLWNFCEGYHGEGITYCSNPKTLYWFNPVAVIQGELLAGASIPFPVDVYTILSTLRLASNWMFGLFLTSLPLIFLSLLMTPLSLYSKLFFSLPLTILTFVSALTATVATVLATVIFVIFRNAARSQTSINIGAEVGVQMFVFMWIGAGCALGGFFVQLCLVCCCKSRRKARREWRRRTGTEGSAHRTEAREEEKEGSSLGK